MTRWLAAVLALLGSACGGSDLAKDWSRELDEGEQDETLEQGLPVRIVVENVPAELGEDEFLLVHLQHRGRGTSRSISSEQTTLENGELLVRLPAPGEYRLFLQYVRLEVVRAGRDEMRSQHFGSPIRGFDETLLVADTTDTQQFAYVLSEQALASLRSQLRER